MTLAAIFLAISCTITLPPAVGQTQSEGQSTQTTTSQTTSEKQDQANESQQQPSPATANPPAATSPQAPSSQPQPTTKHRLRKKKAVSSNCGAAPSAPGSATAKPDSSSPSSTDPSTTSQNAPPSNCPPTKVVVRQGGTSEPSIQLAGGPTTDQAAKQREVVNQLLGVTETNLKKIAGKQLSSSQQDTLAQSRAFVKQSRDAAESGDLDRARTLAWKAELLSEDLLKPQE